MSREEQKRLLEIAGQRGLLDAKTDLTNRRIQQEQAKYNARTQNAIQRKARGNKSGAVQTLKLRKLVEQQKTRLEQDLAEFTRQYTALLFDEVELETNLSLSMAPERFEILKQTRDRYYEKKRAEFQAKFRVVNEVAAPELPPEHAEALAGIEAGLRNAAALAVEEPPLLDPSFNRISALLARPLLGEPTEANERALNELMARGPVAGLGAGAGAPAVPLASSPVAGSAAAYGAEEKKAECKPNESGGCALMGGNSRRRHSRLRKSRRSGKKTTRRLLRRK